MAEGGSYPEMGLEVEYEKAVAALQAANLPSLCPFFIEQGLKDEVLLSLESEEELKELLVQKLQPFTRLWFQRYLTFATPRRFGANAQGVFYEAGSKLIVRTEDRAAEFKSFRAPPPHVGPQNSLLTWRMMEKGKSFICGCLNADRKGIIYFGVGDQDRKILGLEIQNMMDEISTGFQQVLLDHIITDTGASLSVGEQDGINLHFIPVKSQGIPTGLYVIEIEVQRQWMFCEDKVYYSKKWTEQRDSNSRAGSRGRLDAFYTVKRDEWDDVQVRLYGQTKKFKKEEVHEKVKKPLQKKYEEWKKKANQDELPEEARRRVVTELMINSIYEDLVTCWRSLAPNLGIQTTKCDIIDANENRVEEKVCRLLIVWIQMNGSEATVGRLVDALEKIDKKITAQTLLAEAAKKTE